MAEQGAWRAAARCQDSDPEIFFPVAAEPDHGRAFALHPTTWAAEALAVCRECPVRAECLNYALDMNANSADHGVWGGTTPRQRRSIRRHQ